MKQTRVADRIEAICYVVHSKSIFSAINVAEISNKLKSNVSTTRSSSVTERNLQGKGGYVVEKVTRVCDECVDEGVMKVLMMDGT